MGPRRGLRLPRSRRSSGDWRTRCVSALHDGMRRRPRESHGWRGLLRSGRVTGSREASGYPIPVRRLRLRPRYWVAVATANGQACAEWATRGDERRNTAAHGHGISLGAFRTALVLGVDEAGSVSWRSRARRLVGSAARRLDGPSAHRPSGRGRGPGSGFAPKCAIGPRN